MVRKMDPKMRPLFWSSQRPLILCPAARPPRAQHSTSAPWHSLPPTTEHLQLPSPSTNKQICSGRPRGVVLARTPNSARMSVIEMRTENMASSEPPEHVTRPPCNQKRCLHCMHTPRVSPVWHKLPCARPWHRAQPPRRSRRARSRVSAGHVRDTCPAPHVPCPGKTRETQRPGRGSRGPVFRGKKSLAGPRSLSTLFHSDGPFSGSGEPRGALSGPREPARGTQSRGRTTDAEGT